MLSALAIAAITQVQPGPDILSWLANVRRAPIRAYGVKDDKGAGLDCIKIVGLAKGDYLGIYHSQRNGVFELHLARSKDLESWKRVGTLDTHAHQGTLWKAGKRWIAAWEKDGKNGNWIKVAGYNSLADLLAAKPAVTKDLARSLSPAAEGTPSIESVQGAEDWASCKVELKFHYYRDRWVDRQAVGTLTDFRGWSCRANEIDNGALDNAVPGNLGDRDMFVIQGRTYDLLEAQLQRNNWAAWRVILRDRSVGDTFREVPFKTDGGSQAFANPTASVVTLPTGEEGLVVTLFLPKEGAARGEAGQLIFAKPIPARF